VKKTGRQLAVEAGREGLVADVDLRLPRKAGEELGRGGVERDAGLIGRGQGPLLAGGVGSGRQLATGLGRELDRTGLQVRLGDLGDSQMDLAALDQVLAEGLLW
jgi:hypothetical protein